MLERSFNDEIDLVDIVGLRNIIKGSPSHGIDCRLYGTISGQDDDRKIRVDLFAKFQEPNPIHLWHD